MNLIDNSTKSNASKYQLNIPFLSMLSEKSVFIEKLSFQEFLEIDFQKPLFSLISNIQHVI